MKATLFALFVALLMVGCGESPKLKTEYYDNGQKKWEGMFMDGVQDGLMTSWYESGQKRGEVNFFSGKVMSAKVWKPTGEKCPVSNVKDGNGVLLGYNEDGTEKFRQTFKEGQVVED